MIIKSQLKRVVKEYCNKNTNILLVASLGRSGSTMLFRALSAASIKVGVRRVKRVMARAVRSHLWRLDPDIMEQGIIYKTHDVPPKDKRIDSLKCVYLFADPYDVIPSVVRKTETSGCGWLKRHADHLGGELDSVKELFEGDVLDLEGNFDAWTSVEHCDLFAVRYDSVWDYQAKLSEFVGFTVELPPRRARKSSPKDLTCSQRKKMRATYRSLHEKVCGTDVIVRQSSRDGAQ